MNKLQEIQLVENKGKIDISPVRYLRFLIWNKIAFFAFPGNPEYIWKNRRVAYPSWVFLSGSESSSTQEKQIVTFHPQWISEHGILKGVEFLMCDEEGKIPLPESVRGLMRDTSVRVKSFLLEDQTTRNYVWFAILWIPKASRN